MSKYYAVVNGRAPGIYTSWDDAKSQVIGYPKAIYKSFKTKLEAETYFNMMGSVLKQEINVDSDLILYTDGSSIDGYGGCGVLYMINEVIIFKEKYMVPEYLTTNNRAELYAIYCGLLVVKDYIQKNYGLSGIVHLFTDSLISIKSISAYKMDVMSNLANKDIIEKISAMLDKVILHHVDGHVGEKYNEEVDVLAKQGTELSKTYFNLFSAYGTYDS